MTFSTSTPHHLPHTPHMPILQGQCMDIVPTPLHCSLWRYSLLLMCVFVYYHDWYLWTACIHEQFALYVATGMILLAHYAQFTERTTGGRARKDETPTLKHLRGRDKTVSRVGTLHSLPAVPRLAMHSSLVLHSYTSIPPPAPFADTLARQRPPAPPHPLPDTQHTMPGPATPLPWFFSPPPLPSTTLHTSTWHAPFSLLPAPTYTPTQATAVYNRLDSHGTTYAWRRHASFLLAMVGLGSRWAFHETRQGGIYVRWKNTL